MKYREAEYTDAVALAGVSVSSWRSTYAGIFPQAFLDALSLEQQTSRWQDRLRNPDKTRFTLVAETGDGRVIGYAGGLPERTGNRLYTGEVGEIYLLKEYQQQGIGRMLMARVIERLIRQGFDSALVWCVSTNPYRAFYESLGGEPVDTKDEQRAGIIVSETAYGWRDLTVFTRLLESAEPD